ncbi:MAG: hypothetical protein LBQ66_06040 [Planctomycetaceae bacterium]|jgi:hypothetical protein|nr:hypothetical protein [Planctomycetaceae bacterium]
MKIKIYYALYDQATFKNSDYWTWFDYELSKKDRNNFYSDFAVNHILPEPNQLQEDEIWGGIVRLSEEWTVVYRFLNGGRDRFDRPGRYVIVTAWVHTKETKGVDLSPIFHSMIFGTIAKDATKIPVPEPDFLSEEYNVNIIDDKPQQQLDKLLIYNKITLDGDNSFRDSVILFAHIPLDRVVEVKIIKTQLQQEATIEIKPLTITTSPPKTPTPQQKPTPDPFVHPKPPSVSRIHGIYAMIVKPRFSILHIVVILIFVVVIIIGQDKNEHVNVLPTDTTVHTDNRDKPDASETLSNEPETVGNGKPESQGKKIEKKLDVSNVKSSDKPLKKNQKPWFFERFLVRLRNWFSSWGIKK